MRMLVQRVLNASVEVHNEIVGSINGGVLIFIGITHTDTPTEVDWLANKLLGLRIFEDTEGKTNRSLVDCQGAILVISQFTLYADCQTGRRPSFTAAAPPDLARSLYERFVEQLRQSGLSVTTGIFGAEMKVMLTNDGPFTVLLEREDIERADF